MLADYAHHNEDAYMVWYEEEGKHDPEPPEYEDEWDGPYDCEEEDCEGCANPHCLDCNG